MNQIIVIAKKDVEKANLICGELHGKDAEKTFTIPLMDSREYEMKYWCCWNLTSKGLDILTEAFSKAGISCDVYNRDKTDPKELLGEMELHRKEPEGDITGELPK